jgi:hypothetical protein
MKYLSENRVGVLTLNGRPTQVLQQSDLAMNVQLPALNSLPPRVRKLLAPVYTKWSSDWRDALDDACQTLESEARKYLIRGVNTGRITVIYRNGKVKKLTTTGIEKQTLGSLAVDFGNIVSKTAIDAMIGSTLTQVNPQRVGLAHHRGSSRVERELRKHASQHMWAITNCLKQMLT